MIEYETGNLLEANVDALVNTVNTVGVMGKGLALQFRRAYPNNFEAYAAACRRREVEIGRMNIWESRQLSGPRIVINFPTKTGWRRGSRLDDIELGLADLRRVLIEREVTSVAVPALGCGLGGLAWRDVRPLIDAALGDLPARVLVYPPQDAPAPSAMRDSTRPPRMTKARAALLGLLGRYVEPGTRASPLEVQKLAYLLEAAGEPMKLDFEKQRYGPYSDKARKMVRNLEGHYLEGFGDGTGAGGVRLFPATVAEASTFLEHHPSTQVRFGRVAELIEGFESPYGLELLTTTHWVAVQEGASGPEVAAERVREWSGRKGRLFTPEHIAIAWTRLADEGWIGEAQITLV